MIYAHGIHAMLTHKGELFGVKIPIDIKWPALFQPFSRFCSFWVNLRLAGRHKILQRFVHYEDKLRE